MKRLIRVLISVIVISLLIGCSENSPLTPSAENDKGDNTLEKLVKTNFTGTSNFVKPIDAGVSTPLPNGKTLIEGMKVEWYDQASDPRVTGTSIWNANQLISEDGTVKYGGTAKIIVDNNEMWWHGNIVGGIGVANAYGVGVEGNVKGLFARWTYTIDLTVGPPPIAFYVTEGFIINNSNF